MASNNNQNELCRLCFIDQYTKLESQISKALAERVEKYLLIKMENDVEVCTNCFISLQNFHDFYERVHMAQKNFQASLQHPEESEMCNTECEDKIAEASLRAPKQQEPKEIENEVQIFPRAKMKKDRSNDSIVNSSDMVDSDEKCDNDSAEDLKNDKPKRRRLLKVKKITSEIEKKMVEFYNIKCEKCEDMKFTSFKMLSRHYSSVHNSQGYIKCCKRNIRVNDKSYLRSHMFKHLQPDTCRCTICGKELSSLVTLKNHMILHKPAEERPFQCSECDKRFCCKNDLKNHEKAIHLPENEREDFICDVCGKVFQKVANLRYHHSTIHLQERKYICEICAKCFTTQSGLRTHMNAAHSTRGPIQCQLCSKWLKNVDTFHKHLQLHQNNSYPCPHCEKVCNSSTSLRSHMVKHSEDRPYICNICRKSFKTKTHLKNHSVQHTGGSNYKCPYCSKTFVNMSNYYTHRKRMHSSEREGLKREEKPVIIERGEMYHNPPPVNMEDHGNHVLYDFKSMKNELENSNTVLIQNDLPSIRQINIVPPVNLKYL